MNRLLPHASSRRELRVLLADDSPEDRAQMRRLMLQGSARPLRFLEAETGEETLAQVRKSPPDLLILDFHLPDMDAFEVLAQLQDGEGLACCPVAVITGASVLDAESHRAGRRILRAGAQDYLGKSKLEADALSRVADNTMERWTMLRELRAREAALRLQRDCLPVGCIVTTPDGVITEWNAACVALFGASAEEALLRPLREVVGGELPQQLSGHRGLHRHRRSDGTDLLGEWQVTPLPDGAAGPGALLCTVHDVTVREQAARVRQEMEEKMGLAMDAAGLMFFTWDIRSDRVERRFSRIGQLPSTTSEQPGPRTFDEVRKVVHPQDRATFELNVRAALREGSYANAYRLMLPDQAACWVEESGRVHFSPEGEPVRLDGVSRDVTARMLEGQRRAALLEVAHAVLDAAPGLRSCLLHVFGIVRGTLRTQVHCAYGSEAGAPALLASSDQDGNAIRADILERLRERLPLGASAHEGAAGLRLDATQACLPLSGGADAVEGHLFFERSSAPFDPQERQFLQTVADFVALALQRARTERQRRASEMFAQSVVESSPDCIKGLSIDGRLLWMNAAGRRAMHVADFDATLRDTPWIPGWGAAAAEAEAALAAARAGGVGHFQGRRDTEDGEPRWWDVAVSAIPAAEGRPVQLLAISRDVTHTRAADEAVRRTKALLEAVIEGSASPVYAKDLEGRYFLSNAAWRRVAGVAGPHADVTDASLFGPEAARRLQQRDREILEGPTPVVEEQVVGLGGEERVFLASRFPLRDLHGVPYAVCGFSTDITELKRIQHQLERRERELQTLADNSPAVIARFDRALRHVFINSAVERATGRRKEAFLGKTNRELGMPEADCDLWDGALRSVFETGEERTIEFSAEAPTGRRAYAARLVAERDAAGVVEHVLAMAHDVTERRAIEAALQDADRRKDEFLATLAHELRNPLTPIRNGLAILKTLGDERRAAGVRATMERQLGHMVRLIDDLLDVSRIASGKVALRLQKVSLQAVTELAIEGARASIDERHHQFVLQVPPTPVWIQADPTRMAQVVGNLLGNAAKYTPTGGRIVLSILQEGDAAVLRVTDTGFGIPAHMLVQVFDMFAQVPGTLERAQGGLGIGLALVKRLVEMHGGSVAAHSPGPGGGSTFAVRLPLAERAEEPIALAEGPQAAAATGLRVMVVDDNTDAAATLALLLQLAGHLTLEVHDGMQVLEQARAFRPEAVLLDIGLPGLSGYDVAAALRADPLFRRCLLVALTGWGSAEDKQRAEAAGFDHHLTKPVDVVQLQAILNLVGQPAH